MHKQRVLRTPLIAVLGVLAFFAVPAIAQAHHIEATASCKLVDNVSTVEWEVKFVGFSSPNSHNPIGTVELDGNVVADVPDDDTVTWVGNNGSFSGSDPAAADQTHTVVAEFTWQNFKKTETGKVVVETNKCPKPDQPKHPGISIVKDGPSTAYVGSQATFTYLVENTGDVKLSEPEVTDDKCAPVTKVTQQNSFDPGDVWTYTCTTTITDAMGDSLVNIGKVCAWYQDGKLCDEDDHETEIPKPAIVLEKTGAATAAAGSTFTYSFKATNTGNVTLTNVQLTDPKCQSTLTPVAPADTTLTVGESQSYTCTVVAPAGPMQVDNVAKVCGDFDADDVEPMKVCDDDPHTFTVPPPTTPPAGNPPPSVTPNSVPPTTTPPDGEVLPESIVSGRAQLRGPSGCVKQAFRARVRGRSIASVTFFVDGRKVKKVRRGDAFTLKVKPQRYGFGRHKVVAVVRFRAESGTKARRLPLTFRRCAQGAVAPRFTG